jgi:hypothetical protein
MHAQGPIAFVRHFHSDIINMAKCEELQEISFKLQKKYLPHGTMGRIGQQNLA